MVNPPITNSAVSGMPASQAGVAAAIASTSRQVGQSLGVAIVGSAVVSRLHGPLQTGFVDASRFGWWVVTCCGLLVGVVGLATTGRWARRTAARVAGDLEACLNVDVAARGALAPRISTRGAGSVKPATASVVEREIP
jgi:hypothetical protein